MKKDNHDELVSLQKEVEFMRGILHERASLRAENARLRAMIQQVFDADESEPASGGEMWYAETMVDVVKKVREAFNATTPDPLYASAPEMLEALREAKLQIEYLHEKFGETGSGNAVIAKVAKAIQKATKPA